MVTKESTTLKAECLKRICPALKTLPNLSLLSVQDVKLEDSGTEILTRVLAGHKSLTTLDLGIIGPAQSQKIAENSIEKTGIVSLAGLLKSGIRLTNLNISIFFFDCPFLEPPFSGRNITLSKEGYKELSEALLEVDTVVFLNLCTFFGAIAPIFSRTPKIAENYIGPESAEHLAKWVAGSKCLKYLFLGTRVFTCFSQQTSLDGRK